MTPGHGLHATPVLVGHGPGHHVRRLQNQYAGLATQGFGHGDDAVDVGLRAGRLVHYASPMFHQHRVRLVRLS